MVQFDFVRFYSGVRSWVLACHSIKGLRTVELMECDEPVKVCGVLAHCHDDALWKCAHCCSTAAMGYNWKLVAP